MKKSYELDMCNGPILGKILVFAIPLMISGILQLLFNAADTIVVCNGKTLGKPKSEAQAVEMLTMLSGRDHQVMTGLTVRKGDTCRTVTEITHLHFRELSRREILDYVATGEPMDKAGAYGIQGGAALFVERLDGDYYNVMGLPVCRLWQVLADTAPEVLEGRL